MTRLLLDRDVCTILSALTFLLAPKHHEVLMDQDEICSTMTAPTASIKVQTQS